MFETLDASVGGMRLLGRIDAPVGTVIAVEIGDQRIYGTIVRRTDDDFAIQFADTTEARAAMVRRVYSGAYQPQLTKIRSSNVARKVATRLIR